MRKLVAVLPLLGIFLGAGKVTAGPPSITLAAGEGLTQAMAREDCNIRWLAKVMYVNNVAPQELRRLPQGATYTIPFDCTKIPPAEDRFNAEAIMWADARSTTPSPAPTSETTRALQDKIWSLEKERQVLNDQIAVQKGIIEQNQRDLQKMTEARRTAPAAPTVGAAQLSQFVKVLLVVLLLTVVGLALWIWNLYSRLTKIEGLYVEAKRTRDETVTDRDNLRSERNKLLRERDATERKTAVFQQEYTSFPLEISIPRGNGTAATFALVSVKKTDDGYVGCYHCPECSENNLYVRREHAQQQNGYRTEGLARHLEKHPLPTPEGERTQTISL